jgi:predicted lipid-binding transport protein (Tim44 family)
LDFSNVTEEAIENVFVAKAVIILQDKIDRAATKQKKDIASVLAELPETIDMSVYCNDYRCRTDKEAGVSSFDRTVKTVEKLTSKEQLEELQEKIAKQLASLKQKK